MLVGVLCGLLTLAWVNPATQADCVIEGHVALPKLANAPPLPRYPNLNVQPGLPDPPVAVVYLEGALPAASPVSPAPTVTMGQQDLQFRPAVLPVQVGTRVAFPNHDDLYHNVFSYSKPKRFDLGRYRKDEKPAAQLFDRPGLVILNCEIHEHMRGFILVLDTPHFTRTDTNGHFRLEQLPAGAYNLKAWLNERTTLVQPVQLTDGQTLRVEFASPGR